MAIGTQQYQTENILPYSNQSEHIRLEGDYVGILNTLNDAFKGKPLKPIVQIVDAAKERGAEVSDVKGTVAYYVFNGHKMGLRFFLIDGEINRVTYAFRNDKNTDPEALATKDLWLNPRIMRQLKENKASVDGLVSLVLDAVK